MGCALGRDRLLLEVRELSDLVVLQRLLPTVLAHARLGGADDAAWALRAVAVERGWLPAPADPRVLGARWARRARLEKLSDLHRGGPGDPPGEFLDHLLRR